MLQDSVLNKPRWCSRVMPEIKQVVHCVHVPQEEIVIKIKFFAFVGNLMSCSGTSTFYHEQDLYTKANTKTLDLGYRKLRFYPWANILSQKQQRMKLKINCTAGEERLLLTAPATKLATPKSSSALHCCVDEYIWMEMWCLDHKKGGHNVNIKCQCQPTSSQKMMHCGQE